MKLFNKVTIIGVGLMGGSLGLAIKKLGLANEVSGVFRHKISLLNAIAQKAVDNGSLDLEPIKDADLIILASPVKTILNQIPEVLKKAKPGAIIIDIGSTKSEIINLASKMLSNKNIFLGTHPLAGLEKKGVTNARADLFKDSVCILTPVKNTRSKFPAISKKILLFWKIIGAKTIIMDANSHDEILSFSSHLPHLSAFALVNSIPDRFLKYTSGGFKDSTRIALSDPAIWQDIFFSNKKLVLKALERFFQELLKLKIAIKKEDFKSLSLLLVKSNKKRRVIK